MSISVLCSDSARRIPGFIHFLFSRSGLSSGWASIMAPRGLGGPPASYIILTVWDLQRMCIVGESDRGGSHGSRLPGQRHSSTAHRTVLPVKVISVTPNSCPLRFPFHALQAGQSESSRFFRGRPRGAALMPPADSLREPASNRAAMQSVVSIGPDSLPITASWRQCPVAEKHIPFPP